MKKLTWFGKRVALIAQIYLSQNRTDLAVKEVQTARKWAQDSLLIRIADAWVGLRIVGFHHISMYDARSHAYACIHWQGGEKYQSAFYEFEEMAQGPSTSATKSLISQAVAEMHLGRLPEAEAVLQQARTKDPNDIEAIANSIVLNFLSGKDASQLLS